MYVCMYMSSPTLHKQTRPSFRVPRSCCVAMSVTFISAMPGERAPTILFPSSLGVRPSVYTLLGKGSYFFRYILGEKEISAFDILKGHVEVQFMKEEVTFSVYFYDDSSRRMWSVGDVPVDLLAHWEVATPNDLIAKFTKHNGVQVALEVKTLWKTWLRPAFDQYEGENDVYKKLAMLIDNDIMQVAQIKRRNILHEMSNPFSVQLYFTLDIENCLNLRLKAPAVDVQDDTNDSRNEYERLILATPLA